MTNKINKNVGPLQLSNFFDCKSKIILAKINGTLVGSVRVTFLNQGYPDFSYQYVKDPPNMPTLTDIAEGSRLSTDLSVRGMSIPAKLEALMVLTAIGEGNNHIRGSAPDLMIDFHINMVSNA